ncbi:hypothetical protein [Pseudomonas aeruginosa]|uniref:hypothetical protein n=1 Tax=Pseudomonas aeruginosa TaxID=287 RepID=UPI0015C56FB9|nr:hypothetical protein [Pseudomonas aeruginosa]NPW37886.1 hypothetical protein [Pseudomonas aeruginosa]
MELNQTRKHLNVPLNNGNHGRRARLRGWVWGLVLLAGSAAANQPYLQLEEHMVDEPYQWRLSTGEVISDGLSDQTARVLVAPRVGHEVYEVELLGGRFRVTVPARCWKLPAAQFEGCAVIGPREDSAWQREQADALAKQDATRQRNREVRLAWALDQVGLERVPRTIEATLAQHRRWLASDAGAASSREISCRPLASALAAAPSQDTLPREDMLRGKSEAVAAYAQAAQGGNWRAAGGLLDAMLAEEDFESAYVVVAWLLKKEIPAGYYKLGRLMDVTDDYTAHELYGDTGPTRGGGSVIESLRRHAAWLGDPAAQKDLASLLEDSGDEVSAARLRNCATAQSSAPAR